MTGELDTDNRKWTWAVLIGSFISLISAFVVIYLIYYEQKYRNALYLQLLNRLLMSNVGIILSSLFYMWILHSKNVRQGYACAAYLPFACFFLVSSYGYTFMMAVRFKGSHNLQGFKHFKSLPLFAPLALSAILVVPQLIANIAAYPGATWFDGDGGDISSVCTFNRDSSNKIGAVMSLLLLDFPILVIIVANLIYYYRGVAALEENSPYSVVSRRQNTAFGYLFVQLIVFIPNAAFNILSISDRCNECHADIYGFTIVINVLQGFLNVLVYVYFDQKVSDWFARVFCRFWIKTTESNRTQPPLQPPLQQQQQQQKGTDSDLYNDEADNDLEETIFQQCYDWCFGKSSDKNRLDSPLLMSHNGSGGEGGESMNSLKKPSVDLDTEKFVHFGDIETNMMSFQSSFRSDSNSSDNSSTNGGVGGRNIPTPIRPTAHLSSLQNAVEKQSSSEAPYDAKELEVDDDGEDTFVPNLAGRRSTSAKMLKKKTDASEVKIIDALIVNGLVNNTP